MGFTTVSQTGSTAESNTCYRVFMNTDCLIVIDMLHDFLDAWESDRRDELIVNTNGLVAAFRQSDTPVIWVRQAFKADLSDAFLEMREKRILVTIEGTQGAQIHRDLDCRASEVTLIKKRYSAFFGTDLDDVLRRLGAETLVLAGVNTHACIRMTAIDAYQRDLRVILAGDCIGSYDDAHARMSLDYMDGKIASVLTNAQIERAMARP